MIVAHPSQRLWVAGVLLLAFVLEPFAPHADAQQAVANWIVQLAVYVVTSLISRALAPKPKPPEPGKADTPEIKEGKAPVEIFGAVWRKESFLAGWKQLDPPEPIKLKQGKK